MPRRNARKSAPAPQNPLVAPNTSVNTSAASSGNRRVRSSRNRRTQNLIPLPAPQKSEKLVPMSRKRARLSASGRAFLRESLNPCGESEPNSTGVPDGASAETAIVRSRSDDIISIPANLLAILPGEHDPWYVLFVIPPWLNDAAIIIASGFQISDFSALNTLIKTVGVYPDWTQSETTASIGTTVWASRIIAPNFGLRSTTAAGDELQNASDFRLVARGVTFELMASDLTNQGHCTASQYSVKSDPNIFYRYQTVFAASSSGGSPTVSVPALIDTALVYEYVLGNPTPAYLTASNTQTYQGLAKEGVYMPIYKSASAHEFWPYLQRYIYLVTQNDVNGEPIKSTSANPYPAKIRVPDQNFGFVHFKAIDKAASINMKGRCTIQAVIEPESTWSAFSHTSPQEDSVALEAYDRFRNKLQHAYPACYNDWGFLGNIVKGLISKIPVVGGLLSGLVDPAGKLIGGLLGH